MSETTISVVRSVEQLGRLRHEWAPLAAGARSPLLDHDWFLSCAETLHDEHDLRVVAVREKGTLIGAAPLVVEHTAAGRRLVLLGASALYEPGGWLFGSPHALVQTLEAVLDLGRPMLLHRIAEQSDLARAVSSLRRSRAITWRRTGSPSLAVNTGGAWDAYYARLSTRITDNLRRVRKRAERTLGRMEVARREPVVSEVDGLLDTFIGLEESGWKARRGSALSQRPRLLNFFRQYCRRSAEQGRLRVSILSFGSQAAAAEISVEAYNRMWQLKIGYHEALAAYYPGLQLAESSIRDAFDRRLDAYEFLGVAEAWEERWQPDARRYEQLLMYPMSTTGLLGACRDVAGVAWRRAHAAISDGLAGARA